MNMKKILKKQIIIFSITLVALTFIICGSSYALFYAIDYSDSQGLNVGDLVVAFSNNEESNALDSQINITNATPMSDEIAMSSSDIPTYSIWIKNTGDVGYTYKIKLVDNQEENSITAEDWLRYNLQVKQADAGNSTIYQETSSLSKRTNGILYSGGYVEANQNQLILLKTWVKANDLEDDNPVPNEAIGENFNVKIIIEGEASSTSSFTIDANGGTNDPRTDASGTAVAGATKSIYNPTHPSGYAFKGWEVKGGSMTKNGNPKTLTIGPHGTSITALWSNTHTELVVNYTIGISDTINQSGPYAKGSKLKLGLPQNYGINEITKTSGDCTLDGDIVSFLDNCANCATCVVNIDAYAN